MGAVIFDPRRGLRRRRFDDFNDTSSTTGMSFFVTSATSVTGNLGGLAGADATCQRLAAAVGEGARTWRAYLSVEHDAANGNQPTHARDRIGAGPWRNANNVVLAKDLAELHARKGDASVFIDEHGQRINGQWTGSPSPVEHDALTGSNADGTVMAGQTCSDWTSAVEHAHGAGRTYGWLGTRAEYRRCALFVEFGAHESKLREYSPARRGRPVLLLRAINHGLAVQRACDEPA